MTKHRDIIPEVVEILVKQHPGCAIVLVGSVRRGTERPDSDLDLALIVPKNCKKESDHWKYKGVVLCLCFLGAKWMGESLTTAPYVFWPFSRGEILHDPDGIALAYQDRAKEFFAQNPGVVDLWQSKLSQHSASKTDPDLKIDFPDWQSFWDHLEEHYMIK